MKALKIYLAIASTLLVIALGLGVYVWYVFQQMNSSIEMKGLETESSEQGTTTEKTNVTPVPATTSTTEPSAPIVIKTSSLTETQRSVLIGLGFKGDTISITSSMIACAKNAVGETRFNEIVNGGAPSPIEAVKLVPCTR